jgi:hypothetical protein
LGLGGHLRLSFDACLYIPRKSILPVGWSFSWTRVPPPSRSSFSKVGWSCSPFLCLMLVTRARVTWFQYRTLIVSSYIWVLVSICIVYYLLFCWSGDPHDDTWGYQWIICLLWGYYVFMKC